MKTKYKPIAIDLCPTCGKLPVKDLRNEWDDWGRFIDRTLYQIKCCGFETTWEGEEKHAIGQWNNHVKRVLRTMYCQAHSINGYE